MSNKFIDVSDMLTPHFECGPHSRRCLLSANGIDAFLIENTKSGFSKYFETELDSGSKHLNIPIRINDSISPNGAQYVYSLLKNEWPTYKRFEGRHEYFEIKMLDNLGCLVKLFRLDGIKINKWSKRNNDIIDIVISFESNCEISAQTKPSLIEGLKKVCRSWASKWQKYML